MTGKVPSYQPMKNVVVVYACTPILPSFQSNSIYTPTRDKII